MFKSVKKKEREKERKREIYIKKEREGMIERVFARKIYCVRGRENEKERERERQTDRDR